MFVNRKGCDCTYWPSLQHGRRTLIGLKGREQRCSLFFFCLSFTHLSIFIQWHRGSTATLQSGLCQHLWCVQEFVNSWTCEQESPVVWLCGSRASAQPHALLLAHVSAQKEGLQLPFPFDADKSSTLARVAQLLQHATRLLCYLCRGRSRHIVAGTHCRLCLHPCLFIR